MSLITNLDWNTILTSGVIAAIVAGLIEIFKANNNNKATFVIKQREKWREQIRKISTEIYGSNKDNIGIPLTKLKTRINAYGATNNNEYKSSKNYYYNYYMQDSHIHRIINEIEATEEDFENKKQKLIDYLSCLVKYDWDRAKREATLNKAFIVSLLFEFSGIFLLCLTIEKFDIFNILFLMFLGLFYSLPLVLNLMYGDKPIITNCTIILYFICNILNGILLILSIHTGKAIAILASILMILASVCLLVYSFSIAKPEKDYIKKLSEIDEENKLSIEQIISYSNKNKSNLFAPVILIYELLLLIGAVFGVVARYINTLRKKLNDFNTDKKMEE